MASVQAANMHGEPAMRLRQILNEVAEKPTLDVCVIDGHQEAIGAEFADTQNDKIIIIGKTLGYLGGRSAHQASTFAHLGLGLGHLLTHLAAFSHPLGRRI